MDTTQKKKKKPVTAQKRAAATKTATRSKPAARPADKAPAARKRPATVKTSAAKQPEKTVRRKAPARKKQTPKEVRPTPDVVYTPAKPFNRSRLLLRLTTVVAVVLALTFGISIFFKVENIHVSGNNKYTQWTVKEASGIQIGDNLLTFGKAKASGKIIASLPYVDSVRIGIKLPDTVNIEIVELDVAYAMQDEGDNWWFMTSEGRVVEQVSAAVAGANLKVSGVRLRSPLPGQQASAYEVKAQTDPTEESTEATLVTVPVTVTAEDRLTAALSILQYLEKEELFDDVVSVDVSSLGNIVLWYGQQYQVILGDSSQLADKIQMMNAAINGKDALKEYDSGILDITFNTSQGRTVIYEPFE